MNNKQEREMKTKTVISFYKDNRFNFLFSFQKTKDFSENWQNWYIGILFWCLSILIVKGRET